MERTNRSLRSAIGSPIALLVGAALFAGGFTAESHAAHAIEDMVDWASRVEALDRGPLDVAQPELGDAFWGDESEVLGPAGLVTTDTLSLGDGGSVTVGFDAPIRDGSGDDFAVFENGFFDLASGFLFGELAYVEVSSNGVDFARVPNEALASAPIAGFGTIDPDDYAGLAGVDPIGTGTGFDLAALNGHPLEQASLLDLQQVSFVRITDVIGDGSTFDDALRPVHDPYPTTFPTGGFDLDAVGVLNVPEPDALALYAAGLPGVALLARRRERARRRGGAARRQAWPAPSRLAFAAVLLALGVGTLGAPRAAQASTVVGFEDLGLAPDSSWNGADLSGGFLSGGVGFENVYVPAWSYWYGFAASTVTDNTTPGFGNQYSAITGGGVAGSDSYAVFFDDAFDDPRLVLPSIAVVEGFYATNTTYTYLSMRDGDAFAKQFGGPSGSDPDFLTLTISGYDALGALVGSIDFDLADYRFADPAQDYLIDAWTFVDLSGLGAVAELGFAITGSDVSFGFLNTPAYFAMDGLVIVPEPGTAVLVGLGLAALARRRGRRV